MDSRSPRKISESDGAAQLDKPNPNRRFIHMQQMLTNLRARREDERGFTLIELMVVVLIIAIVIAIAIPTFLGAKSRAQDKAAQSSLRNEVTKPKGYQPNQNS